MTDSILTDLTDGSKPAQAPQRNRRVTLAMMALMLLAAAATSLYFAQSASSDTDESTPHSRMTVETIAAALETQYTVQERYPGRVQPRRQSALGFERSGLLASVAVTEGVRVAQGDILASLDTRALSAQKAAASARVSAAKAALSEANARLKLAQVTEQRQKTLVAQKNVSKQRYDDARFQRQSVEAQVSSARAQVLQAEADFLSADVALQLASITAPYSGIITARMADEGAIVQPGMSVLEIQEDGALEFVTGVPAEALRSVNMAASYEVDVGGRLYRAALKNRVSAINNQTRTAQLIFGLEDDAPLVAGNVGRLVLSRTIDSAGMWLPIKALQEAERGLWSVLVARRDSQNDGYRLQRYPVDLLYSDLDRAFVRGTLEPGDKVVTSGLNRLVNGQSVNIRARTAQRETRSMSGQKLSQIFRQDTGPSRGPGISNGAITSGAQDSLRVETFGKGA